MVLESTCITDNQGNEALVVKNMTTMFTLYVLLLELTELLQANGGSLDLTSQRRDLNQDTVDLTTASSTISHLSYGLCTPLEEFSWLILPSLLNKARDLHEAVMEHKAETKSKKVVLMGNERDKKEARRAENF